MKQHFSHIERASALALIQEMLLNMAGLTAGQALPKARAAPMISESQFVLNFGFFYGATGTVVDVLSVDAANAALSEQAAKRRAEAKAVAEEKRAEAKETVSKAAADPAPILPTVSSAPAAAKSTSIWSGLGQIFGFGK